MDKGGIIIDKVNNKYKQSMLSAFSKYLGTSDPYVIILKDQQQLYR